MLWCSGEATVCIASISYQHADSRPGSSVSLPLLANVPEKVIDGVPSIWATATHVRDMDVVPGFILAQLQSLYHWGVNKQIKLSLCLSPSHSTFK